MSGSQSFLRRTEDLKRLKTRALYIEGEDGSLPGPNTLPVFGSAGNIQFSDVEVIGDSMVIPGDLTVEGILDTGSIDASSGSFISLSADAATIQDLSAAAATIQDLSADLLYSTSCFVNNLDVSGSATFSGGVVIDYLDVCDGVYISNVGPVDNIYNTPGSYTLAIPLDVVELNFEMIGAGGPIGGGGNIGGTGGYMRGTINVAAFSGQTITINVGAAGGSTSYISIAGTVLFTVAGAGGGGGGPVGGVPGGAGGGDAFIAGVANGKDGVDYPGIANSYGRGGSTIGGAGGTPFPGPPGILYGQAGANPAGFIDAAGGASGSGARGGNGYAGGGESGSAFFGAGSGGGGSSYYNATYVSLTKHFAGDNPGLNGVLAGYGRSGQGGYVSITYSGGPSLQTTGDIVCGGKLDISGGINIIGDFDICGSLTVGGGFHYRQPNGVLYSIPQRVLVYTESRRNVTATVSAIQISTLGSPFDTLTKIEVEINGLISAPGAAGIYSLNGGINNSTGPLPIAQSVSGLNTTLFIAKHTFELSRMYGFTTKLLDYGSYEAMGPIDSTTGSGFYHPTNIGVGSTTINSLDLSTTAGVVAIIDINIYAYI